MTTRKVVYEEWTTIQIAPLPPGWREVHGGETGEDKFVIMDCPALLLQELRRVQIRFSNGGSVIWEDCESPYRTRVVSVPAERIESVEGCGLAFIGPTTSIEKVREAVEKEWEYIDSEWEPR